MWGRSAGGWCSVALVRRVGSAGEAMWGGSAGGWCGVARVRRDGEFAADVRRVGRRGNPGLGEPGVWESRGSELGCFVGGGG